MKWIAAHILVLCLVGTRGNNTVHAAGVEEWKFFLQAEASQCHTRPEFLTLRMQAACHSREDECLVGDDCLCKVARAAKPLSTLATAPVPSTAPAEPVQAMFRQPSVPALKVQKPKDAKKAEEADKKAKEVWAQAKSLLLCLRGERKVSEIVTCT